MVAFTGIVMTPLHGLRRQVKLRPDGKGFQGGRIRREKVSQEKGDPQDNNDQD
jgi:hypothetical protein